MGVNISQSTAAAKLGTTAGGTAWSGGPTSTGFPVPDVLNLYQSRNYYIPHPVGGAGDLPNYQSFLVYNIVNPRAPLVGDAWETSGVGVPPHRSPAGQIDLPLVRHPRIHEQRRDHGVRGLRARRAERVLVGERPGVLDRRESQDRHHRLRTWLRLVI